MDSTTYLDALHSEGTALAASARITLAKPVPSCPEWSMADLVGHTGVVHRWVESIVRSRAQEPLWLRDTTIHPPPTDELLDWYDDGLVLLETALGNIDPDGELWTWAGNQSARFWQRRMSQETAMHRWDAENAHRRARPFDPLFAVDGIDEMFDVFVPHQRGCAGLRGNGETLHLHCTDTDGEWLVRFVPAGAEVSRQHAKGDAAVRGTASDLLLLLWGRRSAEDFEVFGDTAALRLWTEVVKI